MEITDLSKNLFENGLDFIRQSFRDFEEERYKYSIIHFASGIEVILKAVISTEDWRLLIAKGDKNQAKLLAGTAYTIGIHDCIEVIGAKLRLSLRQEGQMFKDLSRERNKAIHFFPNANKEQISSIHYQAFEELWFFLQRHPERISIPGKEMKEIATDLGKLVRQVKGNAIDAFFTQLEARSDQVFDQVKLLSTYRQSVARLLYAQEISFSDEEGGPFPKWEDRPLGECCQIRSRKEARAMALRLNASTGQVQPDPEGNAPGLAIAWLSPGPSLDPQFLPLVIDQQQRYFWRVRQGSAFMRPSLDDIARLPVRLPCLAEQRQIGAFMSRLDKKISLLRRQLDFYHSFERHIRQKMFV